MFGSSICDLCRSKWLHCKNCKCTLGLILWKYLGLDNQICFGRQLNSVHINELPCTVVMELFNLQIKWSQWNTEILNLYHANLGNETELNFGCNYNSKTSPPSYSSPIISIDPNTEPNIPLIIAFPRVKAILRLSAERQNRLRRTSLSEFFEKTLCKSKSILNWNRGNSPILLGSDPLFVSPAKALQVYFTPVYFTWYFLDFRTTAVQFLLAELKGSVPTFFFFTGVWKKMEWKLISELSGVILTHGNGKISWSNTWESDLSYFLSISLHMTGWLFFSSCNWRPVFFTFENLWSISTWLHEATLY